MDTQENLRPPQVGGPALNDGLGVWIDAEKQKPELAKNENSSINVWGWDGRQMLVVSWTVDPWEGSFWANAYGRIWGCAQFDDDYEIKYWQPIFIPAPPNE